MCRLNLRSLWLSENQAQPLVRLQTDYDARAGADVLTCYLLPQEGYHQLQGGAGGVPPVPPVPVAALPPLPGAAPPLRMLICIIFAFSYTGSSITISITGSSITISMNLNFRWCTHRIALNL